jgi:hypothetical protein
MLFMRAVRAASRRLSKDNAGFHGKRGNTHRKAADITFARESAGSYI